MWLSRSFVFDIRSVISCTYRHEPFSISCSFNVFDQLCMVSILSCAWYSIDWVFYICAVVMNVAFSISCVFLHCFWQKWSTFCSGLDKAKWFYTRGEFRRPTKSEFCKRTPGGYSRLCVGVKMELCQNIPRMCIEEKNTNLRLCL